MNSISSRLLAASCANVVKLWDPSISTSQHTTETYFTDTQEINTVAWSPDAEYLAFAGDSRIISLRQWNEKKEKTIQSENSQNSAFKSLSFGADARSLVTGSQDGTITLWSCFTERVLSVIRETACEITSISTTKTTNPNAWTLAYTNSSGDLSIYQVENHVSSRIGKISDTTLCAKTCAAFSPFVPNGKLFLAAGNQKGQITVWDALTRYSYFAKVIHKSHVSAITFVGKCDLLMSTSFDGTFCTLDLRSSKADVFSFDGPVNCMSLHPDSKILAFGNQDGQVCVKDRRKMNDNLSSCFVHPDSTRLPIKCLTWQPSPNLQKQKAKNREPEIDLTKPLDFGQDALETKSVEFPFSPIRSEVPGHKNVALVNGTRSMSATSRYHVSHQHHHKSQLSNGEYICPSAISDHENEASGDLHTGEHRLSPIKETNGALKHNVVFKTPSKGKTLEAGNRPQVSFNIKSVDRHQRIGSMPHALNTPAKQRTKDHLLSPLSQAKTKSSQRKPPKELLSRSDLKRPRKSGSFSDFVDMRCPSPNAEASEIENSETDFEHKVKEEYWKHQYMSLREDFITMHFDLMKEVRMQAITFAEKQEEMQKQQDEMNEKLKQLTKLVEERFNDSISFI